MKSWRLPYHIICCQDKLSRFSDMFTSWRQLNQIFFLLVFSLIYIYNIYISALASAPSRPPNPTLTPQNQASSTTKKLVQESQKLKKQGVLTVNIIPNSHKSANIAIFSCQKSRVPNKIETWINQNSVVTGIWTYPEKDKFLAVLFLEQS